MTTRFLRPDEWDQVPTPLKDTLPACDPNVTKVVAVFNAAGLIVGVACVQTTVHVDGLWIAPASRRRGSVARRLLDGIQRAAEPNRSLLAHGMSAEVNEVMRRLGGQPLPAPAVVVPLPALRRKEGLSCP